jgi:hypothetical protein
VRIESPRTTRPFETLGAKARYRRIAADDGASALQDADGLYGTIFGGEMGRLSVKMRSELSQNRLISISCGGPMGVSNGPLPVLSYGVFALNLVVVWLFAWVKTVSQHWPGCVPARCNCTRRGGLSESRLGSIRLAPAAFAVIFAT